MFRFSEMQSVLFGNYTFLKRNCSKYLFESGRGYECSAQKNANKNIKYQKKIFKFR